MTDIVEFPNTAKTLPVQESVNESDVYHTLSSLKHYLAEMRFGLEAFVSSTMIAGSTVANCAHSERSSDIGP